jgi:ATP-dependent Clp protease protease subunit
VLGIIAEDTGQPIDRIFADSLHDRWFTAEQAREYGFIDHIVNDLSQVVPVRTHKLGPGLGTGARP